MGLYAITGTASGIGAAVKKRLANEGHETIGIDLKEADIVADLSTAAGCETALAALRERAPDGLDGFIPCAGVGPGLPRDLILRLNYFGALATILGALELLEKRGGALVIIASNSIGMPADDVEELIKLMLAGDENVAVAHAEALSSGQMVYAATKKALTRWMRANCAEWVGRGVRINAVAPGMVMTPLVQAGFADPNYKKLLEQFKESIPMKRTGEPEEIAAVINFLLGPESSYCCGSVLFIDGGADALLHPHSI